MEKELLEFINDWGYKVESENPLVIIGDDVDNKERFVGVVAEIFLKEVKEEFREEHGSSDIQSVKKMDDDQQLLLTASVNYADEFDMSEWLIVDAGTFKEVIETAEAYDDEVEWYFGTNEELSYDSGSEMLSEVEVKPITKEEADAVISVFGASEFGEAGFFEHLFELSEDEEDEEEYSVIGKTETKWIKLLEENGWSIKQDEEDEYTFIVKHGEDESIMPYAYLEELYSHVKKNQ